MTELSPAAQAVLDAAISTPADLSYEHDIAAALRAAAARNEAVEIRTAPGTFEFEQVIRVSDLLAIADELEAL